MMPIAGRTAAVAALALVAACSRNPKPVAVAPPAPTAADQLRDQMHRDSLLAAARADSLAKAQAATHADSVRNEVMRETVDSAKDVTNTGLNATEAATMAERVQFDYNKSDLTSADLQLLQQKLTILQAHPQLVIQVAGNCDERGSDEYNMALGERRAAAAKRWLTAHGIADSRISIISYGEERPLDSGHDESAYAKNRRDDFVVTRGQ